MKHEPHLFLSEEEIINKYLSKDNTKHLKIVLRMNKGDSFFGLDNKGNKFKCEIINNNKLTSFESKLINKYKKPEKEIILVQAILKIKKFEEVIDKATQLGVSKIIPFQSNFTTFSKDVFIKKKERFLQIIKSSAEQSKRVFIPKFDKVHSISEILKFIPKEATIIAYEKANNKLNIRMNEIIKTQQNKIYFICGPEGGFSKEEIESFEKNNFKTTKINNNILRSETAVIYGISNINYAFDIN